MDLMNLTVANVRIISDMTKKNKQKCITKWCRNDRAPSKGKYCYKCRSRIDKERIPITYTFNALRNNARRRRKEFTLTIEEFTQFCQETGYMELKARHKTGMSIDRIDSSRGYSYDNIQIMNYSVNSSKQDNDCPF